MVPLRRAVDLRELAVRPVVVAAVDDHAAHGRAVAVDPLRRGVHDDVRAPLEGVAEVACRAERVVDDEGDVALPGQRSQPFEVGYGAGRVAHALDVECPRAAVDQLPERLGGLGRGDAAVDAEVAQRDAELVVGAAVEVRRGDDVVARRGERQHRQKDRRHARRDGQCPHAAVERRDALLEGRGRGVLQARIDVARLAQLEEPRGVVAAAEAVGRRGIDRHAAGPGGLVGREARMDLQGFVTVVFLFHLLHLFFGEIHKKSGIAGRRIVFSCT